MALLSIDNLLISLYITGEHAGPGSVAQLNARSTPDQEVAGSTPAESATFFVEIDREIFSTVILFLPMIQEGQM